MCSACGMQKDQPTVDSERWISRDAKSPGSRPRLWILTDSNEVHAAVNVDGVVMVQGEETTFTKWMMRE